MPRNITVTFDDGSSHVYQQAPDNLTPDMVSSRAQKDFGKAVVSLDGGKSPDTPKQDGPSRLEKLAKGMRDPLDGGAQLLTHMLPQGVVDAGSNLNNWLADKTGLVAKLPERNVSSLVTGQKSGLDALLAQQEAEYQAKRKAGGESGFDAWRTAGNVVSPVNLALPSAGGATTLARVGNGVIAGASSGALAPVTNGDFWAEKGKQVGTGAAFGGAVPLVIGGAARVVSPKASVNPDLKLLQSEGVSPTIGQTLGGRWNAAEEKLTSLPIMGDMISSARKRSMEQFNNAAINRASSPAGVKVQGSGQNAVLEAGNTLGAAYDKGRAQLGHFQIDQQGAQELGTLRTMADTLPDKERAAFDKVWQLVSHEVTPNGSITAESFKILDSKIGKEAARFGKSSDAYQQQAGDALAELQRVITETAKRANPQGAEALSKADKGWANLVRVEGAAKAAKNNGGVFTPAQLNSAIQQADSSVRGRAVARGTALMQDLGNAGQNVIGNKVPNSFTTDRAMLGLGGLGAGAVNPGIPLALGAGGLLYTSPAQSLLSTLVSKRPDSAEAIAQALREGSSRLSLPASQVGLGLLR
jgi:hypothetical protein